MYEVTAVTLEEFGGSSFRTLAARYADRGAALEAALAYGEALAGPVRDGYRRPTVAVVADETFGVSVKVGDADVDPSYTLIYMSER